MARMRKKRNIPQRMEVCKNYWFPVPMMNKGKWLQFCGMPEAELKVELGCGKGAFIVQMAQKFPHTCFVAIEKDESVLLAAIEKAAQEQLTNVFFLGIDIGTLGNYFAVQEIDELFINFCDPWVRQNRPKRRLTHSDFLQIYKTLLKAEGKIYFKTDDEALYDFSLEEFQKNDFHILLQTRDLHGSEWKKTNIMTEFERKFSEKLVPIKHLIAGKVP